MYWKRRVGEEVLIDCFECNGKGFIVSGEYGEFTEICEECKGVGKLKGKVVEQ
jgi:DnaJ-class molecular chaperone